jgi:rubrerythrin
LWPVAVLCLAVLLVLLTTGKRRLPHLCRTCGYSLIGNVSGRCPECGEAVQPRE